jgi:hypothetical protein
VAGDHLVGVLDVAEVTRGGLARQFGLDLGLIGGPKSPPIASIEITVGSDTRV